MGGRGVRRALCGLAGRRDHLRKTLVPPNMYQRNRPEVMIGNAGDVDAAFDADGKLIDAGSQNLIRQLLENLASWTRQLKTQLA